MQINFNALTRIGLYIFVFTFLILISYRIEIISNYLPTLLFIIASISLLQCLVRLGKYCKIDVFQKEIILFLIIIFVISGALRRTNTLHPEIFQTNEVNRWD